MHEKIQMTEPGGTLCETGESKPALRGWLLKWLLIPAGVAIAAFMMQRSVALIGLDLHHDTLMFDAARQLLNGELPFRDFFYQYNLGTVFFHALALKVLGTQIASLKIATAMVYACIAVLIYICAASALHRRWALAAALVWSILSPFHMPAINGYHAWSTVYMMAAVMGGGLCLATAISGRPMLWAVLAGVCFNLAFWFKQVAGMQILAVLAWVAYNALRPSLPTDIARRFRRMFFGIALGGLASSIPFFFYIFQNAIFEDWWRSAFVFNGYFAASGHSSTGVIALARTFFPVNRELGYISVVWALLPLCLIAIVTQRQSAGSERLFSRSDDRSLVSSLFAALSIAGWIGYFPLAHSFHTQLFMAPMFVLLALQLDQIRWKSQLADKGHWPVIALLSLTMATLVYQAHWHIRGLRGKVTAPSVVLRGEMPASGLRLAPDHALSYNRFYNALLAAQGSAADPQLIPMSVDPLRALLPIVDSVSSDFKMGLNWTFPNEIVEPGFNKRLAMRIADRKSPVYADSLIGIPGYVPVALLEMPSPMTASHTLYVPSADHQVVEPPVYVVHNEVFVLSGDAFPRTERAFLSSYGVQTNFTFIKLDNLVGIPSDDIGQLHVSTVRSEDIPSYLSKFQYEQYMKAVPGELAARVAELYERKQNTRYELRWPLEHGQTLDIAKFLLSQGKLFEAQDRPMYFTTLGSTVNNRPFLVWKSADEDEMRILWAKPSLKGNVSAKAKSEKAAAYFMAIPSGVVRPNEESILYVQVVMKDYTTRNFYLHYLPT
jgi:hypothetical protein